ncbi:AraC family transcriptional regulator [Agrobacterium tumefaciens]|uniref:helix-turn-helix transcriptional regulator n=1 Tax=Agrobacterium tumefaciens TaxID=358 RepID=UPI001572CCBB|nr:helix-turn-helix transcriptional regulator [Agrobacterium tumefaciens]UXT20416.1 AraC family transcriptional regulator [Agrobacterium tumefaciens]WHO20793.1 helix-turn-helix transcriptional regulator [Agrobacterium tumefaciens]WHO23578.1 helix-turn-helix transcriptional regulator [Agrobacterium tumefaciens]
MPKSTPSDFSPRFQGSTFEYMHETFTGCFGPFDAWRTSGGQTFGWKADFWSDGRLSLVSSQYSYEWCARAAPETPEWLSLIVPRAGAVDVMLGRTEIEGTPGRLLLTNNREAERFSIRGAPHRSDVLRLNWTVIAQTVTAVLETPLIGTMELMPVLDISTAAGQLVGSLAQTIIIGMRNNGPLLHSPIAMSNLTQALADLVVRSVPHRLSYLLNKKVHLIAPRHVRRAVEFMHANIGQPLTMQSVAEAAGVSIRALETGFRDFKGTSPLAYLRTIRLRAVREDLLDPSNRQSLREICLKWGFFHFGRFSAVYRVAYGENPSETRKRSGIWERS